MKISTVLDQIENQQIALPEFQRGYVWSRDQVRGLVRSLYKRYPVGSMLAWSTSIKDGEAGQARGVQIGAGHQVKMLLDGQQRMTSLYGIVKGEPPVFFDGDAKAFTDLYFNVATEEFSFYMASKMKEDVHWISVTELMKKGPDSFLSAILSDTQNVSLISSYSTRLNRLRDIRDIDVHIEDVSGEEMTLDVVVDIFNRVNSGGRKLSKGDLALAKICSVQPNARNAMREALKNWQVKGFDFQLDWLLRNVTTIASNDARFTAMHDIEPDVFDRALAVAIEKINFLLDLISSRLGLDHHQVLKGYFGFPVLVRLLHEQETQSRTKELQDKILFWYIQSAIWGRYSNSTESTLSRDLNILLANLDNDPMQALIDELLLWRGDFKVRPEHFKGWSKGNRFYFILYMLTRIGEAKDLGLGIELRKGMLGRNTTLEVHHIFPRAYLRKQGITNKAHVNAIANFCFLTKNSNLKISSRKPADYFKEVEQAHPGVLMSQWIPADSNLWQAERYMDFLEARQSLLADALNMFLKSLYPALDTASVQHAVTEPTIELPGGINSEEDEELIDNLNAWCATQGLPVGEKDHELMDKETGEPTALLALAWPDGLQSGLSQPVAFVAESAEAEKAALKQGYKVFDELEELKTFIAHDILDDKFYGLPEWSQTLEEQLLPVVHHIIKGKLPEPAVNQPVQVNGTEVCIAKLLWGDAKILVTDDQLNPEQKFALRGWMVISSEEANEAPHILNVALQR